MIYCPYFDPLNGHTSSSTTIEGVLNVLEQRDDILNKAEIFQSFVQEASNLLDRMVIGFEMASLKYESVKVVTIKEREYLDLIENKMIVDALKIAGVENLSIYKAALRILQDERRYILSLFADVINASNI